MYHCINGHAFERPDYIGSKNSEFAYDRECCPTCRTNNIWEDAEMEGGSTERALNMRLLVYRNAAALMLSDWHIKKPEGFRERHMQLLRGLIRGDLAMLTTTPDACEKK